MPTPTFYFYDLETSGFNPRSARIMQFAGQRTSLDLKPIGPPHNVLIKMTDDILPEPDAVLITGITPQKTHLEGISEAEFLELFHQEIATPGTIFVGFNTIRFDDEFMRYLNYRNFYDPYEWQWKDDRSRWDLLDVVRMTRALRPEGIKWPFDSTGAPTNRLEFLTSVNKLEHTNAHDALSDVMAVIDVARLIRSKQPKLFEFLLKMRDKKEIAKLVNTNQPFVYSSGKYPSEFEKTTVAVRLADHPKRQGTLVYDLRHDPAEFADMTPNELVAAWQRRWDEDGPKLPIKTLQFNRCPAVAPLSVLDDTSLKRLQLDLPTIKKHRQALVKIKQWPERLNKALELMDKQQQERLFSDEQSVDAQLYDGFFSDIDRRALAKIRKANPNDLGTVGAQLKDKRLKTLLPLYKARNFFNALTNEERQVWDEYRRKTLLAGGTESRLARYFQRLEDLPKERTLNDEQRYLLEELQLYGEGIIPSE